LIRRLNATLFLFLILLMCLFCTSWLIIFYSINDFDVVNIVYLETCVFRFHHICRHFVNAFYWLVCFEFDHILPFSFLVTFNLYLYSMYSINLWLRYLDIVLPNIQKHIWNLFSFFFANKNLGQENGVLIQDIQNSRVQIIFIKVFTFNYLHLQ